MGKHRISRRGGRAPQPDKRQAGHKDAETKTRLSRHRNPALHRWVLLAVRVFVLAFFLSAGVLFTLVQAMPVPDAPVFVASTVYGRNDEVVARLYLEDRTPVSIRQMPQHLLDAVIAVEDYRYYSHAGVDPIGIIRAAYRNLLAGRRAEGASTISQQLARTLYLTQKRTYTRKIQEAIIALKLEQRLDKQEILEGYLNQVYWGHGAFGVEVAAQIYFAKTTNELTLAESALLAGVLRSPENYSPHRDPTVALRRRSFVLGRMVELGYITEAEASAARDEELRLGELRPRVQEAPYFTDYILAEITRDLPEVARGVYQSGYEIYTTLDLEMQRAANEAMRTQLTRGDQDAKGVTQPQAALVAVDPQTGGVLAMVGGRSYRETQLNRAAQAHRQPGSAFKPFLYAGLIDRGYTVISQMTCEPVTFPAGPGQPPYAPVDYGTPSFHNRPLTMREAIMVSDNVCAVRWAYEAGPQLVIDYARRMGVFSPLAPYLPIVLGTFEVYPLELAIGYCPLANGGLRVQPLAVRRVVDREGNVVMENAPRAQQAIPASTAFLVTDMLKSVMGPGGTGAHLGWILNRPSAGKTGTTNDRKDAWFVGYVPQVVCAVYVGYDEPATLWGPGGRVAGPIWAEFMRLGLRGVPVADFPRPPDVVDVTLCRETLQLANPTCPATTERFRDGTQPIEVCPLWHLGEPQPPQPPEPGEDGDDDDEPGGPDEPGLYHYFEFDEEDEEAAAAWRRWLEQILEAWHYEGDILPEGP